MRKRQNKQKMREKNFNLKFGISNLECEPLELGVAKLISNSKLLISNYSKILHLSAAIDREPRIAEPP